MTALATAQRPARAPRRERGQAPAEAVHRGGATLEDLVLDAWEGLSAASHSASCPACGGALVARFGAGSRPVGGVCTSCRSTLE